MNELIVGKQLKLLVKNLPDLYKIVITDKNVIYGWYVNDIKTEILKGKIPERIICPSVTIYTCEIFGTTAHIGNTDNNGLWELIVYKESEKIATAYVDEVNMTFKS